MSDSQPPQSTGPYARLILRDGDTVRASGQVVAVPGRHIRFCAPLPVDELDLIIRYCDDGVDVVGVDLHRLVHRETQHGAVRGEAQLTGVYRSGTLRVTAQGPPRYDNGGDDLYHDPPCPAPISRALRDDYPHQLCVVHSRYTKTDVHVARRTLMLDQPDSAAAGAWGIGSGLTDRYQVEVDVQLRQVTPAVAADAAAQARGLVKLEPWLTPQR